MDDTVASGDHVVRTFMFTDVVHSAPLWERAPDAMERALARHDDLVTAAASRHDGLIVKHTGDGMFVVFADPVAAVRCAVEAQRELVAEEWPEHAALSVRMGLHMGPALPRAGDYFGSSPNRCNRIMSVARGGQILLSDAVAGAVAASIAADGWTLRKLGPTRLRGLAIPEDLHEVVAPDLPVVRDHVPPIVLAAQPPVASPIIGREVEIAAVHDALATPGLVTLVGPGGVGKTRIAIEVARRGVGPAGTEVGYVDLSAAGSAAPSIGAALGVVSGQGESTVDALVRTLADARVLVVLDNCEHLLDDIIRLVNRLVAGCPELRILATSQALTGAKTERCIPVEPLLVGDAEPGPAMRLFEARARTVDPAFDLSADPDSVRAICIRLDGLPLAIELAAARVRSLPPAAILDRLDHRLQFLRSASPVSGDAGQDRRATLEAAIEWSYRLLDDAEQAALIRLGCFHGPFDLEAAEAVVGFEPLEPWEMHQMLDRLVGRSLVQVDDSGPLRRFRLLESIAAFARDRLRVHPDSIVVWERHHDFFLDLVESAPDRPGVDDLDRIDVVAADVRPSIRSLVERDPAAAADLLLRRYRLVRELGWQEVALGWFSDLVQADPHRGSTETIDLLKRYGQLCFEAGLDLDAGRAAIESALKLALDLGEDAVAVRLRLTLCRMLSLFPASLDVTAARSHLGELDSVKQALDDPRFGSMVDGVAALLCLYERRNDEGIERALGARQGARAAHAPELAANALALQGAHLAYSGRIDEGLQLIEEAWAEADEIGDDTTVSVATWLRGYASILLMDPSDASAWLQRELRSGRAETVPAIRRSLLANLGVARCLMGHFDTAKSTAPDSLRINGTLFEPLLAFAEHDPEEADAAAQRLLGRLRDSGDRNEYTALTYWTGRFALSRGLTDVATGRLHEALELAVTRPACPYYETPIRSELAIAGDSGQLGRVRELVAGTPLRGLAARAALAEAVHQPDLDGAEEWFAVALRLADQYSLAWDRLDVLLRRSVRRRAAGDVDGADADDARIDQLAGTAAEPS